MSASNYDVIIIGAGPGGYVCAIRCAQIGMRVACIDAWHDATGKATLGGTCLNVGCIPSKALLDSSHHYKMAKQDFGTHGIIAKIDLDLKKMLLRKDKVVAQLNKGVAALLQAAKVTVLTGKGQLLADKKVRYVSLDSKEKVLQADHIVLATGSSPVDLKSCAVDDKHIVNSTGALNFKAVPKRLGIIGAGVIGLELGSVWARLGAEVTIFEALPDFLPMVDTAVAKATKKILNNQGLQMHFNTRVERATSTKNGVTVDIKEKTKTKSLNFDKLIVAVGRTPLSSEVLAEGCGVHCDDHGFVIVDEYCKTEVANVYAIGDLVRGPMLAHKASEEAMMVAERLVGKKPKLDYDLIPGVVYTHPEVAWVGKSRQELDQAGVNYRVGEFPFAAIGRAIAAGEQEGMVVILADADTDRILGCHIVGAHAADLVQQIVLSMEFCGSAEDLALSVFAHPTLSEAVHEAALAVDNRSIHMAQRRKPPR